MDVEYIKKVKEWVSLDNKVTRSMEKIKTVKDDIQDIIDERKDIEDDILDYIQTNKFEKLTLNISDGTIKFGKRTTTTSLSLKLLKALFEKYAEENPGAFQADKLHEFLIENLEKKTTYFIKRDIDKPTTAL